MKATLVLLAIVGYLPLISSGAKSIHDWAHELGNKLGPGYSFREVERDGRTCICSTTTQQTTESTGKNAKIPQSTEAASTTTVKPSTVPPVESTTVESTTVPPVETTTTETVPKIATSTEGLSTTTVKPTTVPPVESTAKPTTVIINIPSTSTTVPPANKETTTTTVKIPESTEAPSTTPPKKETTTPTIPPTKILLSTEAPSTTVQLNQANGQTTTFDSATQQNNNLFGDRSINCDSNVVPVANDRNAATKYIFSTPLYPNEYPEHTCCIWRIVYPEEWMRQRASRIVTYNYSPDSFLPEECSTDFVKVYDITVGNILVEREEKCGNIGGQLGIIKHDGDELGAAFRVCSDEERTGLVKNRERESTGKVAISFTVVAF